MQSFLTSACVFAVSAGLALAQPTDPDPPEPSLDGTWTHNSFVVNTENAQWPSIKPWSPTGELTVTTGADGKFKGALIFTVPDGAGSTKQIPLDVTGEITPAADKNPPGFTATGVFKGAGGAAPPVVYQLKGWFVPAGPGGSGTVVQGAITNAGPDLPGPNNQPPDTVGTFLLRPKTPAPAAAGR